MYLRITKFNNSYTGEYSTDGINWVEVNKFDVIFTDERFGLTAHNGPGTTDIPADFDKFQLREVGTNLYVAPDGNCGEAEPCYATIQDAIDTAESFDTIKVAAGTYTDLHVLPRDDVTTTGVVTQVVYLSKTLSLQGGYSTDDWTSANLDKNLTTIDAQNKGRGLYITSEVSPKIEGFHITGGDASGLGGEAYWDYDAGGGIYIWKTVTTINRNQVQGNSAEVGGGIYINGEWWGDQDKPLGAIVENKIFSNTATHSGGGLSMIGGAAQIMRNIIRDNEADGLGGGMSFLFGSSHLHQNLIRDNTCTQTGGGIYFQWGDPTFVNNVIIDNHVENMNTGGNGLHIEGASPRMSHNTIARNTDNDDQGSGIYLVDLFEWAQPTMYMTNTILADQSVGIFANGISTLTVNGILWHNTPVTITTSPTAVLSVSHQHNGNPTFAPDGHHLAAGSEAIDKGLNAGITSDIDGEPRPAGAGFDLGADELWIRIYLPLVQND